MTLLELGLLLSVGSKRESTAFPEMMAMLRRNPVLALLPITFEIVAEVAAIGPILTDPTRLEPFDPRDHPSRRTGQQYQACP